MPLTFANDSIIRCIAYEAYLVILHKNQCISTFTTLCITIRKEETKIVCLQTCFRYNLMNRSIFSGFCTGNRHFLRVAIYRTDKANSFGAHDLIPALFVVCFIGICPVFTF